MRPLSQTFVDAARGMLRSSIHGSAAGMSLVETFLALASAAIIGGSVATVGGR